MTSKYGELEQSYVININQRYIIHITEELEGRVYLIDNYGSSYCISWEDHDGIISNRKTSFEYYKNKPFTEYLYTTGGNSPLSNECIDFIKSKIFPNNNEDLVKELLLLNK